MNLSEELENIYTSNDIQLKKQQLINPHYKIFDFTMNEQILNLLQEQIQQLKQSFDNIKQKEQPLTNDLSNNTKELHDQASSTLLHSISLYLLFFR